MTARHAMRGTIAGAGFASGDRIVVGAWERSPLGPFTDVMWADPDDTRTLFAPDEQTAAFVTAVYDFDRVSVVPLRVAQDDAWLRVELDDRRVELRAGRPRIVPFDRPLWATRLVEAPLARVLMGVRTYGTSPTGVREWYQARSWRFVIDASGQRGGIDLGPLLPEFRPAGFGFSEPPRRPSIVRLRVALEFPTATSAERDARRSASGECVSGSRRLDQSFLVSTDGRNDPGRSSTISRGSP